MITCTHTSDGLETVPAAPVTPATPLARVLLIEDSGDEMLLVKQTLQEFGQGQFKLEWSRGLRGRAARRLRRGRVDVVLLDLGLSECEGPATCVAVRDKAPYVPIVVLTGDERKKTEELAMACGADDYLVKDQVSPPALIHAIRAAICRKKARSTSWDLSQL